MDSRNESMFLRISYTNPATLDFLFEINFMSLSHLEMLASYFPNMKALRFRPGVNINLRLDTKKKIYALHLILQRLDHLNMFTCWCTILDEALFRDLFTGWEISYGQYHDVEYLKMTK